MRITKDILKPRAIKGGDMRHVLFGISALAFLTFLSGASMAAGNGTGRDSDGELIVSGLVKNEWGFSVKLPADLSGYHNSPVGIQGHGMVIPIAATGTASEVSIEFFAGYNAANFADPGCEAHELSPSVDKDGKEKFLMSSAVLLDGLEGWKIQKELSEPMYPNEKEEELFFLRNKDLASFPRFKAKDLLHSFQIGCTDLNDSVQYPGFAYVLDVIAPEDKFETYRALFAKILLSWKWSDITDR
jgi:hypothetical protein